MQIKDNRYQGGKQGCYNIYMTKPYCNQKAYLWDVSISLTGIDPKSTEHRSCWRTLEGCRNKAPLWSLGKENYCLQPLELSKTDANKSKLVITYNVRHTSQTWNSENMQMNLVHSSLRLPKGACLFFVVVFFRRNRKVKLRVSYITAAHQGSAYTTWLQFTLIYNDLPIYILMKSKFYIIWQILQVMHKCTHTPKIF